MSSWELLNYCVDKIGVQYCDVRSDYEVYPPDYWINIPCGTCYHCLKNKRNYWVFRLLNEFMQHKESTFVTLTLDDASLQEFQNDYKRPLKLYLDRLRKALGFRPRYWFISELGDEEKFTGRLHYHGFFFGTNKEQLNFALQRAKWTYGVSWFGYVHTKTIYYVTKYVVKQQPREDYKPFVMCSNGIGASYITKDNFDKLLNNFDPRNYLEFYGKKFPISPYYRYKFFDDELLLTMHQNQWAQGYTPKFDFRGVTYSSVLDAEKAKRKYYLQTLSDGLSLPKKYKDNSLKIDVNTSFDIIKQKNLFDYE